MAHLIVVLIKFSIFDPFYEKGSPSIPALDHYFVIDVSRNGADLNFNVLENYSSTRQQSYLSNINIDYLPKHKAIYQIIKLQRTIFSIITACS